MKMIKLIKYLIIFTFTFIIFLIANGAILKHHYLGGDQLKTFRNISSFFAEIPSNLKKIYVARKSIVYNLKKNRALDAPIMRPTQDTKTGKWKSIYNITHQGKILINLNKTGDLHDRFRILNTDYKKDALLVLPRYSNDLSKTIIEIIDLNNYKILKTYNFDIANILSKIDRSKTDADWPPKPGTYTSTRAMFQQPMLKDNGSIITIFARAIFKFDKCGKIIWKNDDQNYHHSLQIINYEEDEILVTGSKYPYTKKFNKLQKGFLEDAIYKLKNGKVVYKKSILEIFVENNYMNDQALLNYHDPLHLNDAEIAKKTGKYWNKDDIFLSLRDISQIIHYRPSTNKIVNMIKGPFAQQHDVDLHYPNKISIFNNSNKLTDDDESSEILFYDFENKSYKKVDYKFPINPDSWKIYNFKTKSNGLVNNLKDGSTSLEEHNKGRIFYFDKDKDLIWVYFNENQLGWHSIIEDQEFIENFKKNISSNTCKS